MKRFDLPQVQGLRSKLFVLVKIASFEAVEGTENCIVTTNGWVMIGPTMKWATKGTTLDRKAGIDEPNFSDPMVVGKAIYLVTNQNVPKEAGLLKCEIFGTEPKE